MDPDSLATAQQTDVDSNSSFQMLFTGHIRRSVRLMSVDTRRTACGLEAFIIGTLSEVGKCSPDAL